MDTLSKESRRKNMQAIKGKETKLETRVSHALWYKGIRFRKNVRGLYGNPDIAIRKHKVAIFIDSCFWHACPLHCHVPETNREFWLAKLERNKQRDQEVTDHYHQNGWRVLRVWEHDLKHNFCGEIQRIVDCIHLAKQPRKNLPRQNYSKKKTMIN